MHKNLKIRRGLPAPEGSALENLPALIHSGIVHPGIHPGIFATQINTFLHSLLHLHTSRQRFRTLTIEPAHWRPGQRHCAVTLCLANHLSCTRCRIVQVLPHNAIESTNMNTICRPRMNQITLQAMGQRGHTRYTCTTSKSAPMQHTLATMKAGGKNTNDASETSKTCATTCAKTSTKSKCLHNSDLTLSGPNPEIGPPN